ncbi:MAG: hypothetical protein JSS32_10035 [Verrucomicrobia bacterium]|nr:hypothetical protein [Verrucomicrobiota bacterium]
MNPLLSTSHPNYSSINEQDNLLLKAIQEGPIEHTASVDKYRSIRQCSKSATFVAAMCANASFIPITLNAGIPFAIGNSASFLALDFWALNATFDDAFGPRTEHEALLVDRMSKGKCYTVSLAVGSVLMAVLSQFPNALPSLDYNGNYAVPGMVFLLAGGAVLPLRSLQLTINKAIQMQKCVLGEDGKKIESIRSEMVSLVQGYQNDFEYSGQDHQLQVIQSLNEIRNSDLNKVETYLNAVFDKLLQSPQAAASPSKFKSACTSLGQTIGKVTGLFLAASLETGLSLYTFDKTQTHMIGNPVGAGLFTAAVIGSGVYLYGKAILDTTQRVTSSIFSTFTGQRVKGLAEQLRPTLTLSLRMVGLLLNLGTFGPNLVIWGDFFKDNATEKTFFEATLCSAYFVLVSTATLDLVDSAVKQIVLSKGTDNEKEIIHLHQELQKLQKLLTNTSTLDFSLFLLKAPPEVKTALLNKVDLSLETLEAYGRPVQEPAQLEEVV